MSKFTHWLPLRRVNVTRAADGRVWCITVRVAQWYWITWNRGTGIFLSRRRAFTHWEAGLYRFRRPMLNHYMPR